MLDGVSEIIKLSFASQLSLEASAFSFNPKSIANIASLAENVLKPYELCICEDHLLCNVGIIYQAHKKSKLLSR